MIVKDISSVLIMKEEFLLLTESIDICKIQLNRSFAGSRVVITYKDCYGSTTYWNLHIGQPTIIHDFVVFTPPIAVPHIGQYNSKCTIHLQGYKKGDVLEIFYNKIQLK